MAEGANAAGARPRDSSSVVSIGEARASATGKLGTSGAGADKLAAGTASDSEVDNPLGVGGGKWE
jgi:hypothetical protein